MAAPDRAFRYRGPFGRELAAGRVAVLREASGSIPPPALVLLAVLSVQLGAAMAKSLFEAVGPGGAVFLRVGLAALLLAFLWRRRLAGAVLSSRRSLALAATFGFVLAGMNFCFYSALERIPLGVAVTLEFTGPLAVALLGSRRLLDFLWGALAAGGIFLLSPFASTTGVAGGEALDPVGVIFALLAGAFWACYVLLGGLLGRSFAGGTGLALATGVGAVLVAPVGLWQAGTELLAPGVLLAGAGIALLSTAIPYTLEIEALKRMPARVFGVLMSLEPAVAALIGFVILSEALQLRSWAAILLVSAAAAGSAGFRPRR
ncbi:EamA family transporter [Rubrobacter taiwanensis]|nr:EamA family transporter [Rubrobacter taiwanensis]